VAAGYQGVALVLQSDGSLWASGEGILGTLGLGDYSYHRVFAEIASSGSWASFVTVANSFAISRDGTLWAWGCNLGGGLGLGDPAYYSDVIPLVLSSAPDGQVPTVAASTSTAPSAGAMRLAAAKRTHKAAGNGWSRKPVTVHLRASDIGSGVSRVRFSTSGGISWTSGAQVADATLTVTRSGITSVLYQAIDRRGNASPIKRLTVRVDRLRPRPFASAVTVRRGHTAALRYKVADVSPLRVTLVIKNSHGATVKRFVIAKVRPTVWQSKRFHCTLAKGTYRWHVSATDSVGYRQTRTAVGKLIVK
jgi:hypothetical protein